MSKRLPVELNIPRLCANKARLRGTIKLSQFKRLAEYLREPGTGDLDVELKFANNPESVGSTVDGYYSGDAKLECHRCAEVMDFRLAGQISLAMVQTDAEAEHVDGNYDPFPLDESGRVRSVELIEDELILQIPLAPRHSDEQQCAIADWISFVANEDNEPNESRDVNPFDVLKNLS